MQVLEFLHLFWNCFLYPQLGLQIVVSQSVKFLYSITKEVSVFVCRRANAILHTSLHIVDIGIAEVIVN